MQTPKSPTSEKGRVPERRALGKGLDSLLPRIVPPGSPAPAPAPAMESGRPLEIPLSQIERNPFQTRTVYDEAALDELADSIRATGVIQPILLRPLPQSRYQLIAGERRWLAAQRAGLAAIPAILRQVSDEQVLEITIVENLQRVDLNPMEQAKAFHRLSREFGMTQEQMAIRTGKDRSSIANFLRLLRLPTAVQEMVEGGQLSFGHARALLALETASDMETAARRMYSAGLSVRQAETLVRSYRPGVLDDEPKRAGKERAEPQVDPNVADAEQRLRAALGMRVKVEDKNGRGRVIIEYAQLDDFDTILERLTGGA